MLIIIISLITLVSCDSDIVVIRYEFVQYPRLIYVIGEDTELDFNGTTFRTVHRDGFISEAYSFGIDNRRHEIRHEIDFTTPGIYRVEIVHRAQNNLSQVFYIEVIHGN